MKKKTMQAKYASRLISVISFESPQAPRSDQFQMQHS